MAEINIVWVTKTSKLIINQSKRLITSRVSNNTIGKYCNTCISTNNYYNTCSITNNYCNTWTHCNNYCNNWTHRNTYCNTWAHSNNYCKTWTHSNNYYNTWTHRNKISIIEPIAIVITILLQYIATEIYCVLPLITSNRVTTTKNRARKTLKLCISEI